MKVLIVIAFLSLFVFGQCAMEYKVHDYLVRHAGFPTHKLQGANLRNQTPNYQLHGGVNQTYDVHRLLDVEEWRKDLENAKQAGPQQLKSFIDTVTQHHKQASEHYLKVKEDAHNQANEYHQALEQLKQICIEAEKKLEVNHGQIVKPSGFHVNPTIGHHVNPVGYINPSHADAINPKPIVPPQNMRDQHRHVTDSEPFGPQNRQIHDQDVRGAELNAQAHKNSQRAYDQQGRHQHHIPDHQTRNIPDHVHPAAPQAQPARGDGQGFFSRMVNVLMANE